MSVGQGGFPDGAARDVADEAAAKWGLLSL